VTANPAGVATFRPVIAQPCPATANPFGVAPFGPPIVQPCRAIT
jgi:hypothetical protein